MKRYREAIILAIMVSVVAILTFLGLRPPPLLHGRVLSAEPRPWFGASAPKSLRGLSVFGIAVGDDLKGLEGRLYGPYHLQPFGTSPRLYTVRGRNVDLFLATDGSTITSVWARDLGTIYLDGQPIGPAGRVKIGTILHDNPGLTPLGNDFQTPTGEHMSVVTRVYDKNEVDFLWLMGDHPEESGFDPYSRVEKDFDEAVSVTDCEFE